VRSADALDLTLATQYAGLQRRYKHSGDPEEIMASYKHQREQIGGSFRVFVTESAGKPLGFVLALQHDDVLYTRHAGFERGEGRSSNFVYFNTLFYAMIEYAIEQGVTRIEYGTESYDAKRRRGASTTDLESFVKTTTAAPEDLADYLALYERGVRAYLTAHGARFTGPEEIR
jgi:predicted N-acyltransferase